MAVDRLGFTPPDGSVPIGPEDAAETTVPGLLPAFGRDGMPKRPSPERRPAVPGRTASIIAITACLVAIGSSGIAVHATRRAAAAASAAAKAGSEAADAMAASIDARAEAAAATERMNGAVADLRDQVRAAIRKTLAEEVERRRSDRLQPSPSR